MRQLIILGLLLASVLAAAPQDAFAHAPATNCHDMAAMPAMPDDEHRDAGDVMAAVHACPGCAAFNRVVAAGPLRSPTAAPFGVFAAEFHASRASAPIPPPPRA